MRDSPKGWPIKTNHSVKNSNCRPLKRTRYPRKNMKSTCTRSGKQTRRNCSIRLWKPEPDEETKDRNYEKPQRREGEMTSNQRKKTGSRNIDMLASMGKPESRHIRPMERGTRRGNFAIGKSI